MVGCLYPSTYGGWLLASPPLSLHFLSLLTAAAVSYLDLHWRANHRAYGKANCNGPSVPYCWLKSDVGRLSRDPCRVSGRPYATLLPPSYSYLPLGSIMPQGWIANQLNVCTAIHTYWCYSLAKYCVGIGENRFRQLDWPVFFPCFGLIYRTARG
jgi:hypothetical protein